MILFRLFFIVITIMIILKIIAMFIVKKGNSFDIYFGVPGSGKTTFGAWITKRTLKKGKPVYSNVEIKGSYLIDAPNDLGHYLIENGTLIIDEAGIEFNNREFKKFSKENLYFFKYHRHYKCNIVMFSQDLDMDLKLRKLATGLYIVYKGFIPFFIKRKRIIPFVGIDKNTNQIVSMYKFDWPIIGTRYIFAPRLWKMFNSYERKELPTKEFKLVE